jgi:drug/metabolite transporter (DMT)-like permease
MGVLNVAAALCFWNALKLDDVSRVAPITYLFPALVALLTPLVLPERADRRTWIAVGLAIAGATLVVGDGLGRPGSIAAAALAFGSAVATACFYITAGRATRERDWLLASATVFAVGALLLVPMVVASGLQLPTGRGWLYLALIILVGTIAPFFLFFAGMARIGPTHAAVFSVSEPVLMVLLAFVVLNEHLGPYQAFGVALVLASFLLATANGTRSLWPRAEAP